MNIKTVLLTATLLIPMISYADCPDATFGCYIGNAKQGTLTTGCHFQGISCNPIKNHTDSCNDTWPGSRAVDLGCPLFSADTKTSINKEDAKNDSNKEFIDDINVTF